MTMPEIKRLVDGALQAARKNGATVVEVKIVGDEATVKISLAPDATTPIAEPDEIIL
ncbi:MAG: hypothetical protein ACLP19_16595 [Xanthobacteraceae bacterium]